MKTVARCNGLMAAQHGVMQRRQALERDLTPKQIKARIGAGEWLLAAPSTYVHSAVPESFEARLSAAVLWGGPGAFACGRSAAAMHELEGFDRDDIEVAIYTGGKLPGANVRRLSPDDRPELASINGILVSSIERTILDLAGHLPLQSVGPALDDALRRRLTSLDRVNRVLDRDGGRGRRGTVRLRTMLAIRDERDALAESRLESKMLRVLKKTGRADFVPQFEVVSEGFRARLDFAFPALRLGIETHGYRWHSGLERWQRDLRRDRRLKLLGWTILYFSWDEVVLHPAGVLHEIEQAVAFAANFSRTGPS